MGSLAARGAIGRTALPGLPEEREAAVEAARKLFRAAQGSRGKGDAVEPAAEPAPALTM